MAVLSDGTRIEPDTVLVGVGAVPNVELAEAAGLRVDNGVLVDSGLRTSHPAVFAAGDVANATHPLLGTRIRVEHWQNAISQGRAAAHALLGERVSYAELPYFFSDQYDLGMEFFGHAAGPARRDRAGRERRRLRLLVVPQRGAGRRDARQPVGPQRRAPGSGSRVYEQRALSRVS